MPKQKKVENATNVNRVPRSEEIFNVGRQPSIPTRGFSKILTDSKPRKTFKLSVKELKENRFIHE